MFHARPSRLFFNQFIFLNECIWTNFPRTTIYLTKQNMFLIQSRSCNSAYVILTMFVPLIEKYEIKNFFIIIASTNAGFLLRKIFLLHEFFYIQFRFSPFFVLPSFSCVNTRLIESQLYCTEIVQFQILYIL